MLVLLKMHAVREYDGLWDTITVIDHTSGIDLVVNFTCSTCGVLSRIYGIFRWCSEVGSKKRLRHNLAVIC